MKNWLSTTHAVSAVKCFNTKVIWKCIWWRVTRRVLQMIILFHLLLLRSRPRCAWSSSEELSLSGLNLNEDKVENNTENENTENSVQSDFVEVEINPTEEVNSRNFYYQKYRERKTKLCSLEEMVQSLSSPQKNKMKEVFVVEDSNHSKAPAQMALYVIPNPYGKKGLILSFTKFYLNFLQTFLKMTTLWSKRHKTLSLSSKEV